MRLPGIFFGGGLRDSTYCSFCCGERAKGGQEEKKGEFYICLCFLTAIVFKLQRLFRNI